MDTRTLHDHAGHGHHHSPAKPDPEAAILDLKVIDPAAGSGHFLIAAAHRIAARLASIRAGGGEP